MRAPLSRNYNYHRRQALFRPNRYTRWGRDRLLVILMLIFGLSLVGWLLFLQRHS